jgi:hypothetical protein
MHISNIDYTCEYVNIYNQKSILAIGKLLTQNSNNIDINGLAGYIGNILPLAAVQPWEYNS